MSNIKLFFEIMYGDDYPGQLAIWTKQTKRTNFYKTNQEEEMEVYITDEAKTKDVYFGLGLLEDKQITGRGKAEDVTAIPGFWMDVDLIADIHKESKLPSKEEALKILKEFSLMPTLINHSGYGLHVFWLFKELWQFNNEEERKEAAELSKRFQHTIIKIFGNHGHKIDNTADLARLLRIPGTFNHKGDELEPVNFLRKKKEKQNRYSPEDFISEIDEFEKNTIEPRVLKTMKRAKTTKDSFPENNAEKILERCQWLKKCRENARILPEPEWFHMLTIVALCKDSLTWACKLSEDYDGYTENETIEKVKRIQKEQMGPVTCSYIQEKFNGHCDSCSHNVKSPILLGRDYNKQELKRVGFIFDKDEKMKGINGNKFARYILKRYKLLYMEGDRFYFYKDGIWKFISVNQLSRLLRDLLHEFAPDFWTERLEEAYFAALKLEAPKEVALDSNRDYLNLKNGMLNLTTFKLEPHHSDFRSSIKVPFHFDKDADCPNFKRFLIEIFEGDEEIITVIQEIFGYCLTAETSAQKAFFFYGKGANGKSLLAEILLYLCGKDNTSAIQLKDLEKPFSCYDLVGKLLNLATENQVSPRGFDNSRFNAISVGDVIRVEKKFEQGFDYNPVCKLVFLLNNLPYSRDKSWGFHRRLTIIPFNRTFKENDPNTKNYDELKKTLLSEMTGILNFALEGLERLRKNKFRFSLSKAIEDLHNEYKQDLNPYLQFVGEMIAQGDENDRITNESMGKVFRRWCSANGHERLAKSGQRRLLKEVRDAMKETDITFASGEKCKSGGGRYTGKVRLKNKNLVEEVDELEL